MSIKDSPGCDRYRFQNETLVHMFCECPDVKIFWKDVIDGGILSVRMTSILILSKVVTATNQKLPAFTR